jgi:hypothetical protein
VPNLTSELSDTTLTPEEESALCPNENWEAVVREGSLELVSYTYTIDFVDAEGNVIENYFTLEGLSGAAEVASGL